MEDDKAREAKRRVEDLHSGASPLTPENMLRAELALAYAENARLVARLRELEPNPPRRGKVPPPDDWCSDCGTPGGKHALPDCANGDGKWMEEMRAMGFVKENPPRFEEEGKKWRESLPLREVALAARFGETVEQYRKRKADVASALRRDLTDISTSCIASSG